ncbi:hypothetical protein [Aeromonas jandaei]|uniref:hypothetical protein n=1 Tax=Aeromonas jandaei TaxID=650 RepID=UPI002B05AD4F|nr:hypothetical protein [Aeromonas jandaei]
MEHVLIEQEHILQADLYSVRNELESRLAAMLDGEQVDPAQLAKDQSILIANFVTLVGELSAGLNGVFAAFDEMEQVGGGFAKILRGMGKNMWNPAATPPEGEVHKWTRDVVVVTSAGKAYTMAYMHGHDGDGVWQSPAQLQHGEVIEWWTEVPATK